MAVLLGDPERCAVCVALLSISSEL